MEQYVKHKNKSNNPIHVASKNTINIWKTRLNSLSEDYQKHIANKYYGGKMPWKK